MKRQIIITDLTRFNNKEIVCTAGIDLETKECIRPLPYLERSKCEKLSISPGHILSGDFEYRNERGGPHTEDSVYSELKFEGPCSSETFKKVLEETCHPSIATGFQIDLPDGDRGIPVGHPAGKSIITLQVDPASVQIVEGFKPGTLKLQFQDSAGRYYYNFPITDLGFHEFAQQRNHVGELGNVNQWIYEQDEVFLRIGLSGEYQPPGQKKAYWMQVNGIYTFPDAPPSIRKQA